MYYISPPNPDWPEQVQADYIAGESDLLFTSIHEVWPGHFLNFMHANRSPGCLVAPLSAMPLVRAGRITPKK